MQHIVILGAGFGGIRAALELDKQFRGRTDVKISIIDKHDYQLFHPSLYEIATAEEEMTETLPLKKSITVPLAQIFHGTRVEIIKGVFTQIDHVNKFVQLEDGNKVNFTYLVLAQGSTTDYFGIEGAKEHSFPLKTLQDALRIRNEIEFTIQRYRMDVNKKNIRIIIAGGGYTGCEFAAELGNMLRIIGWKNNYPHEKIEIVILEAMNQVIPGLDERLSRDAYDRLDRLGIRIQLSSMITRVDEGFVELASGEKEAFDVLVWTTGVKALPIPFVGEPQPADKKERLNTKTCLQILNSEEVFAIGDAACIFNEQGRPVPPTAQNAIAQAKYVAWAISVCMGGHQPSPYAPQSHGFIVTLGGKWAILKLNNWYLKGFVGYLVRIAADLRYFYQIVGAWNALKIVLLQTELFSRND
jgi:NADH:ubiquinone reductase (H+-translocating)